MNKDQRPGVSELPSKCQAMSAGRSDSEDEQQLEQTFQAAVSAKEYGELADIETYNLSAAELETQVEAQAFLVGKLAMLEIPLQLVLGSLDSPLAELMKTKLFQDEIPHHVSQYMVLEGVEGFRGKAALLSRNIEECRVIQQLPPRRGNTFESIVTSVAKLLPTSVKHLVVLSTAGFYRVQRHVIGKFTEEELPERDVKNPLTCRLVPVSCSDHSTRIELARLVHKLIGYGLAKEQLVTLKGSARGGDSCLRVQRLWEMLNNFLVQVVSMTFLTKNIKICSR